MRTRLLHFVVVAAILLALVHLGTPRAAEARCWYCDWNGNYCTVDSTGWGGYENCDVGCDFSGNQCEIAVEALNAELRATEDGRVLAGYSPVEDAFAVLTCTGDVDEVVYSAHGATYRRAVAEEILLT